MAKKLTLLIAGPMLTNACLELLLVRHDWQVIAKTHELLEVAELAQANDPDRERFPIVGGTRCVRQQKLV